MAIARKSWKPEKPTKASFLKTPLPAGVLIGDLVKSYANGAWKLYADYPNASFDMWYVESFGWVIPTLHIRNASSRSSGTYRDVPRTYACKVSDGSVVRVGLGPHVLKQVTVHVKKSRLSVLQKYLDMRQQGAADANTIRDRISTRRARGALRRTFW